MSRVKLLRRDIAARYHRFAEEYVKDFNGKQAVLRCQFGPAAHAHDTAHRYLNEPECWRIIINLMRQRSEEVEISAKDAVRYWFQLAIADARELIPVFMGACRFCYGVDHDYQYTDLEQRDRLRKHVMMMSKVDPDNRKDFMEMGGDGFDPYAVPHPTCPGCHGKGEMYDKPVTYLEHISPAAAMLVDGFKVRTFRDGTKTLEVKVRQDRSRGMENVQKLLGFEPPPKKPILDFDPEALPEDVMNVILQKFADMGLIELPQQQILPPEK